MLGLRGIDTLWEGLHTKNTDVSAATCRGVTISFLLLSEVRPSAREMSSFRSVTVSNFGFPWSKGLTLFCNDQLVFYGIFLFLNPFSVLILQCWCMCFKGEGSFVVAKSLFGQKGYNMLLIGYPCGHCTLVDKVGGQELPI